MVYGLTDRSREADIVIWDSANYPSLPMLDHAFYFAESVRAVIESKSRWSADDFADVRSKTRAVRDVVPFLGPSLDDAVSMLELEIAALRSGREHDGFLTSKPHIGTAAIFLDGGSSAFADEASIPAQVIEDADDSWPDLVFLVQTGVVVVKVYGDDGNWLRFFELGDDALLFFTHRLLRLLTERVVLTEAPFYFTAYAAGVLNSEPYMAIPFRLRRTSAGRMPLWRD